MNHKYKRWYIQISIVRFAAPVLLLVVCCLTRILDVKAMGEYDSSISDVRAKMEEIIDPQELQSWAEAFLKTNATKHGAIEIKPEQIPAIKNRTKFKRSLISITASLKGDEMTQCITFVWGSGRRYFGIKVGSKKYLPIIANSFYRKWIEGVYIYYVPGE